jgi:hypothetical protein
LFVRGARGTSALEETGLERIEEGAARRTESRVSVSFMAEEY